MERLITGLKVALKWRGCKPLTPYIKEVWAELLLACWEERYPCLVQSLTDGFDIGIPYIRHTYSPPNHSSVFSLPNVYSSIINSKFKAGCYIGPFLWSQLELALGPFQTSPLSLVLKTLKLGTYQAVHNFSHLHSPSCDTTSINSHINCNDFPCTWGTFSTVALLISHLPPGSQALIHDVAEAYRTIPECLANGQDLSFNSKQMTSLQLTPATTLVFCQQEEYMVLWQTQGLTFSEGKVWAPHKVGQ